MELIKTLPVWLLAVLTAAIIGLFTYGAINNRTITLWPPAIHAATEKNTAPSKESNSVAFSSARLARLVERSLGKTQVAIARRTSTYTIKAIKEDIIIMDTEINIQVENTSPETIEEEFEFRVSESTPPPEVTVDGVIINSRQVRPTSPDESYLLYKITIPRQETRQIRYRMLNRVARLPFNAPDLTTRPTHHSELTIEGSRAILEGLYIQTIGLTSRDNWDISHQHTASRIIYGWQSLHGLLPYQGAYIHISLNEK